MTIYIILSVILFAAFCLIVRFTVRFVQFRRAARQARGRVVCPACHHKVPIRYFLCSRCGRVNDLTPTEEEIFYAACPCGERLPKLPRLGRDRLTAVCPNHKPVAPIATGAGHWPDIVLPIVGNTSAGKSAFLAAWVVYARTELARQANLDISFPFPGGEAYADECRRRFSTGTPPRKTSDTNPLGLGMDLVAPDARRGARLYLYDPAGEVFDHNPNSLQPFHYYDYMDGAIFLIDPFATPGLRRKYSDSDLYAHHFEASDKNIGDGCEKFIRGMYGHNLAPDEYHFAACAVVITKAEAFDLDKLIGRQAAEAYMRKHPGMAFDEALGRVCRARLRQWGLGNVVKLLESHFNAVRYFSVSSYGHMPENNAPFEPARVEMPILWLLEQNRVKVI